MTRAASQAHRAPASARFEQPAAISRRAELWHAPAARADASRVSSWTHRYVRRLVCTDALSAVVAVALGWTGTFGFGADEAALGYIVWSVILTAGWLLCVHAVGGYEIRRISTGTREYQRVLRASLNLAGCVAILGYLAAMPVARTFLAMVIPVGATLMVVARYVGRKLVYRRRSRGEWTNSILAVGTRESVRHLIEVTRRNPQAGLRVVGACVEDQELGSDLAGVPVLAHVQEAVDAAERVDADVVAVAGSGLGPRRIRELGWALEGTGTSLVMAPGLTEVAGPRVHVSPVEGLPLMWVDQPQFSGMRRLVKRAVDVLGAGVLLLLAAPVLILIYLAVRLTSRGPAIYRSVRTGQDGRVFIVYKFRSMTVDAEQRFAEVAAHNEVQGGVLFKMRNDPRVTAVGRLLRKFSLDELPQLLNVLGGTMSLVGPRPPLPDEVQRYNPHVHRRLLVKPGMTGLWQVSGRSDLSWEESVRLDLYYVENWSLTLDLAIIARTVWAVLRGRGAY